MKWFKTKKEHHKEGMAKLFEVCTELSTNANSSYSKREEEIKECPKCHIKPDFSFNSRGITSMMLKCRDCEESYIACKDMDRLIKSWNAGERNEEWPPERPMSFYFGG